MFDKRWHLRKERFIAYQIAMLTGLAAECTATYSLSKYNAHQNHIQLASFGAASEYNNDLIGSAISTIVFCVFVATVFGTDFFFLVFWPRRRYAGWYHHARAALALVVMLGMFASAIASTIVIATHEARILRADAVAASALTRQFARPPLRYRSWAVNIAWVVLLWIATISTIVSTILLLIAASYDRKYGPEPIDERITPVPSRTSKTKLTAQVDGKV